jgi:hypothetical protein
MHPAEARLVIKPVFDFLISTMFGKEPDETEYQLSLLCFQDFVDDTEPYWVLEKTARVIKTLLNFDNAIGDCPESLKECVLAVVKIVKTSLGREVDKELNKSKTELLQRDISPPNFLALNSWARIDWTRPRPVAQNNF